MPVGQFVYRLLHPSENPKNGIKPRDENNIDVTAESHIMGKRKSPYISTCASKDAVEMYYGLAKLKAEKDKEKKKEGKKKKEIVDTFVIVKIDINKLKKEKPGITIIDLSDPSVLNKEIKERNKRGRNWARKYQEVLILGSIPDCCIEVMKGYQEIEPDNPSDYTGDEGDMDELESGMQNTQLNDVEN